VKFGWSTIWEKTCEWHGVDECKGLPNGEMAIVSLDLGTYLVVLSLEASVRLLADTFSVP
jgi:hypothetical protein